MAQDDTSALKTTTFKLFLDKRPRIYIDYKDKHDLFKQFKRKTRELGLSPSDLYLVEYDVGEPIQMNNADALMDAAAPSMCMFVRDGKSSGCCQAPHQEPTSGHDHHHGRRHHTHSRRRSKSRDHFDRHHHSAPIPPCCGHFCGSYRSNYSPCGCPFVAYVPCCCSCRCFHGY